MLVVSADGSCNAVDYVDPRRFRREDGEGCETEKLTDHYGKSQSTSVPQTVSKLHLLSFCLYSTMLASRDAAWIILYCSLSCVIMSFFLNIIELRRFILNNVGCYTVKYCIICICD